MISRKVRATIIEKFKYQLHSSAGGQPSWLSPLVLSHTRGVEAHGISAVAWCTEAVPVFLPNTCWLKDEKARERNINRQAYQTIIEFQIKHIRECVLLLPDSEGEVFGSMVPLHLHQVPPALPNQHEGLRVEHL